MIWHVFQRALESAAQSVWIATDDERIAERARQFTDQVLMTAVDHSTGTDRLAEVVESLGLPDEAVVVNVQGDEPLLPGSAIDQVASLLRACPEAGMATLCEPITEHRDLVDPHQVKVVFNAGGRALYFSRAPIPGHPEGALGPHFRHIGLYAYRAGFLRQFTTWDPTPLEQHERLEQLRALEHDIRIQVAVTSQPIPPGVDTETDLARVRAKFEQSHV